MEWAGSCRQSEQSLRRQPGTQANPRHPSAGQGAARRGRRRESKQVWCQTRICTMTSDFVVTAFSRPGLDLRHGSYRGSPKLPRYRGWIEGDFASRSLSRGRGSREIERRQRVITMPVYLFREKTMSVDAIE
jgi:hypothetical protein